MQINISDVRHNNTSNNVTMDAKSIIEYINNKISPYEMSNDDKIGLLKIISEDNFTKDELIKAVEISAYNCLHYDENGNAIEDGIGGLPIINQRINYIKGICRNKLTGYNDYRCRMILDDYVDSLRICGYNEEKIVEDLNEVVMPMSKDPSMEHFSWWEDVMKKWIKENKEESSSSFANGNSNEKDEKEDDDEITEMVYFKLSDFTIYICKNPNAIVKVVSKNGYVEYIISETRTYTFDVKKVSGLRPNTVKKITNILNDNCLYIMEIWNKLFGYTEL